MFKVDVRKRGGKDGLLSPHAAKRLRDDIDVYVAELHGRVEAIGKLSPYHLYPVMDDDDEHDDTVTYEDDPVSTWLPAVRGEDGAMLPCLNVYDVRPNVVYGEDLPSISAKCSVVDGLHEATEHELIATAHSHHREAIAAAAKRFFCVDDVAVMPKLLRVYREGEALSMRTCADGDSQYFLGMAVVTFESPWADPSTDGNFHVDGSTTSKVCVVRAGAKYGRSAPKKGFRVEVTFGLYGEPVRGGDKDAHLIAALKAEPRPFGLTLTKLYDSGERLSGAIDSEAVRLLEAAELEYTRVTVVIDYLYDPDTTPEATTRVYPINGTKVPEWMKDITFYPLAERYPQLAISRVWDVVAIRYTATALVCGGPVPSS